MASARKVNPGQRRQMIAEAAYFRAEQRGFVGGDPAEDWYMAESEVDACLRQLEAEPPVAGLDEVLVAATKKLTALKKKLAGLSGEARMQWQRDADRLAELRDALRVKLDELRERGEETAHKVRLQAEKIGAELAEQVHQVGAKRPPKRKH